MLINRIDINDQSKEIDFYIFLWKVKMSLIELRKLLKFKPFNKIYLKEIKAEK
jgi:hypothetical protein